jgi:ribosome recycling factor
MIDDLVREAEVKMNKSLEVLQHELATIRTGRATPSLLDRVQVDYYGAPTPLQQLAQIHAPEPRLLVVQPYDRNAIAAIEKALQKSELGLTPANDGQVIRIPFPQLTEERRHELAKVVKHRAEETRVAIRNIRREELHGLEKLEKDSEVSKDEAKRGQEQLQKVTDSHISQADQMAERKEAEILEV